eukprot:64566-Chlamydomonas_euryale.AAC.2
MARAGAPAKRQGVYGSGSPLPPPPPLRVPRPHLPTPVPHDQEARCFGASGHWGAKSGKEEEGASQGRS